MVITDLEKNEIKQMAKFLENRGYTRTERPYSIDYTLDNICISIVYPPNSDESDVNIRFIKKNEVFSVGWIALVRGDIKGSSEKCINIKELLKYVESQYLQIIDYQFCVESNYLIDKYVEKHQEKFKNAIQEFLSKN